MRFCGSALSVDIKLPRYAPQGGSAVLRCEYSVQRDALHKVEFQRGTNKLFQYIKDRKPPFRYFEVVGGYIDRNQSNETQIVLQNLQLDASGYYTCEVSTIHPIFTKRSNEEELTVIQPQRSAPQVTIRKVTYELGEVLEANCSSSPAHPVPHITWLLNGATVPESALRFFPSQQVLDGEILGAATVQLTIPVDYPQLGEGNKLHLACVSTIPAFVGPDTEQQEYADYQREEVEVAVVMPEVKNEPSGGTSSVQSLPVLLSIALLGTRSFNRWR